MEDDEDDFVIARELLLESQRGRCKLEWAATYDAGIAALSRQAHDLCICDYRLGQNTGLDFLSEAERLAMPYELGRVHLEIGRHSGAGDPARQHHLAQARDIFDRIGAVYDAARAQAEIEEDKP